MAGPDYNETIETHGVVVPLVESVISPRMREVLRNDRYERQEVRAIKSLARPDDVVLDLGAGVGVVATIAARTVGDDRVTAVEANPNLIPILRETFRLNGVPGVTLIHGAAMSGPDPNDEVRFRLRPDFWASSLDRRRKDRNSDAVSDVAVPAVDLAGILDELRPTVFVLDIEGGELAVASGADLSSVRLVIMELHPRVYGASGVERIFSALSAQGFTYDPRASRGGTVVVFSRYARAIAAGPSVCAVTCMKDEAPFILEWVAYHRAIGIGRFLVFSNDCSDGTTELLDELDRRGIVRHLPNPSRVLNSPHHQPIAVQYAKDHKEARDADWVISMDVDEFINIHAGAGRMQDLFAALPEAEIISLTHLDFGCSGVVHFEDRFITEQMTRAAQKTPAERERRGVKSLVGRHAPENRLSNHRPYLNDPEGAAPVWVDGSGRPVPRRMVKSQQKGIDCRGSYDLAQINHYPVRSMESYLVKTIKGDVVVRDKYVGAEYFAKRDARAESDLTIARHLSAARAVFDEFMDDPVLRELHRSAVRAHLDRIEVLLRDPDKRTLLEEMRAAHAIPGEAG